MSKIYAPSFLQPIALDGLIRLGHKGDGGYVVPDYLVSNADALLSFGMSTDWSFELDVTQANPNITIHVYDHTVGKRYFWRTFRKALKKFLQLRNTFSALQDSYKKYSSYKNFFQGKNTHFEERVFNRIEQPYDADIGKIFSRVAEKKSCIVKMDIEGGEYRVIDQLLKHESLITLLIIEFHDIEPLRETFNKNINSICQNFAIAHIHGNNSAGLAYDGLPDVLEITFVNKRDLRLADYVRKEFPVAGLDFPTNPEKPDYPILFE